MSAGAAVTNCVCGHPPKWHRRIDTDCLLCAECGMEERRHGIYGHRFTQCNCKGDNT